MDLTVLSDHDLVWDDVAFYLAGLCASVAMICSPEVIIIGGGVMERKVIYGKVRREFKKIVNEYLQHEKLEGKKVGEEERMTEDGGKRRFLKEG